MKKTGVLIVDKDVLVRQAIAGFIQQSGEFYITGLRRDVRGLREALQELQPHVLLLDTSFLESDNFRLFKDIINHFPRIPVVLLSPKNEQGAELVIRALHMGAFGFITKPEYNKRLLFAGRHLAKRLLPALRAAARYGSRSASGSSSHLRQYRFGEWVGERSELYGRYPGPGLVVIGGGTGGHRMLFHLIPSLPAGFDVPVVIVQHFPREYTPLLARDLNRQSQVEVREAYDGAPLQPGIVWVAPGGKHCEICRDGFRPVLRIHRGARESDNRPSIDSLFRSAAGHFNERVWAILLGGEGEDGIDGVTAVRGAGGRVTVIHPRHCLAPTLALRILQARAAHDCATPEQITEIIRRGVKDNRGEDRPGPTVLGTRTIANRDVKPGQGASFKLI